MGRCERRTRNRGDALIAAVQLVRGTNVRPRRGPVVQTKDALDNAGEVSRDVDRPLASAKSTAVGMAILGQLDAERSAHRGHSAAQDHAVPSGADFDQAEAVRPGERFNFGDIGGIGAVTLGVRLAGEMVARFGRSARQQAELRGQVLVRAPAHTYGDFEALVGMYLTDLLGTRDRLLFATGEWYTILLLGH